jgi:hypothetical protein
MEKMEMMLNGFHHILQTEEKRGWDEIFKHL